MRVEKQQRGQSLLTARDTYNETNTCILSNAPRPGRPRKHDAAVYRNGQTLPVSNRNPKVA